MELVSPEGLRVDGRRPGEVRRLRCSLGVVASADGSALLLQGGTRALAAVYGPREAASRSAELHDRCSVTCEVLQAACASGEPRRAARRDRRSAEESASLRCALEGLVLVELLPRCSLHVAVTLLSLDGSAAPAAFNAAVLALADAGVPLRDTAGCATAALLNGAHCVDVCRFEEAKGPEVTVAVLPSTGKLLVLTHREGRVGAAELALLTGAADGGARHIAAFMAAQLKAHTRRAVAQIGEA